jgi:MerR family Zn(II)-responsive transcriptional regulator of zntA
MMTVSELSHTSGVAPHVVRYYARIGLLQPDRDPDNGYRHFHRADLLRLRFIRQAQSLGFTLEEVSQVLEKSEAGQSPCADVRTILRQRIRDNREKLAAMQDLQDRMEAALESWEHMPDQTPQSRSVCHLIETSAADT